MQTDEHEVELIDYVEIVLKRKWLILGGTLVCIAGMLIYLLVTASPVPLYAASAQIFIASNPNPGQESAEAQVEIPFLTPDFYETVAVSDEIAMAMNTLQKGWIDSLGLEVPATLVLEPKVVDKTRLEMRVQTADTLLTRLVLYAWVDTFISRTQTLNATETERYYNYVIAQYDTTRKYLENTENALMQLNIEYSFSSLRDQQQLYLDQIASTQGSLVQLERRLEQKAASLSQAKELVRMLEVGGEPLFSLPATALPALRGTLSSDLARQLVDNLLELQRLKDRQAEVEAQGDLKLRSFDETHGYSRQQMAVEELTKSAETYRHQYLEARSKELTSGTSLKALEEEMRKHPVSLQTSGKPAGEGTGSQNSSLGNALNPTYVALAQKSAEEGLVYETARLYASQGAQQLESIEAQLEEAQRLLRNLKAERGSIVAEVEREKQDWGERIKTLESNVAAVVQSYLASKKNRGDLEIEIVSLEATLANQRTQLSRLNEKAQSAKGLLLRALKDSVQLGRDKETYAATFERFAQLSEEARIAQQKITNNLRIVSRDATAKAVGIEENSRKKVLISGAVGLLLSTLLAFLLEYVHRARVQRAGTA